MKRHRWVHCNPQCKAPSCAWCVDCGEDRTNHKTPWVPKKPGACRPGPFSVVERTHWHWSLQRRTDAALARAREAGLL